MDSARHCIAYPTHKGWYLELADLDGGREKDARVFGPVNSLEDIDLFRLYVCGYLGGLIVLRDLRSVPSLSPNGSPVAPVELDHRSGWESSFQTPKPRFIASKDDVQNYMIFDTVTDIAFAVPCVNAPNPRRIASVRGLRAWRKGSEVDFTRLAPKGCEAWAVLVLEAVPLLLAAGWVYDPFIISGLPQQPISPRGLAELLP
jgi:hypothetical protein